MQQDRGILYQSVRDVIVTRIGFHRFLLVPLLFIILSFLSQGCGNPPPSSKPIKVAINAGPEGDAIKKLAPEYSESKVDIVELPYQSLREQLITVLQDRRADFDLVMVDDPWFPQLADKFTQIKNIPKTLLDDFVQQSLALCSMPYGTDNIRALPFVGNTQLLFYRKDILSRLNIDEPPSDWSELAKLAKSITLTSKRQLGTQIYGYSIRGKSGAPIVTDFLPVYWSLGGKLVDDIAEPNQQAIDRNKFVEALKIYKELKDSSPPGSINYNWSEMTTDFIAGKVVMQLNWPAAIPSIESKVPRSDGNRKWDVALPPGKGKTGTSMIGNWLLAIPSDSKQVEKTIAFLVWLIKQQQRVATALNPPTLHSVFKALSKQPDTYYFKTIETALMNSTPRARTPFWIQIEDAVSRVVSAYLTGGLTELEGAAQLEKEIEAVFSRDDDGLM